MLCYGQDADLVQLVLAPCLTLRGYIVPASSSASASTAPAPVSGRDADRVESSSAMSVDSKIQKIQEVFPTYGEAFILAGLQVTACVL